MADIIVGPVDPTAHNSAVDENRPADFGVLSDVAPDDIKTGARARAAKLTPLESQAVRAAGDAVMFASGALGEDEETQLSRGNAAFKAILNDLEPSTDRQIESHRAEDAVKDVGRNLAQFEQGQQAEKAFADTTSFLDQTAAAFAELTAIPALIRTLEKPDFTPDPNFDYMEVRDKVEAGLREEDRQYLRESTSELEMQWRLTQVQESLNRVKEMGAHGPAMAVASGLMGGIVDPVGWVAGMGVGKVAQLGGVGARVALEAGQTGRAVGFAALEGATGNVLTEAALDAAGGHVTQSDYIYAAAFGAAFGQLGLVGGGNPAQQKATTEAIREQADETMAGAQATNADLYSRAQARVRPDATPEEIRLEVDRIQEEEYQASVRIGLSAVPEGDRVLPEFNLEPDPVTGTIPPLDEVMAPVQERVDVQNRWGMGPDQIEDASERKLLGEVAARAENWAVQNPFNAERLDSLLAKVPWLSSTGLQLARSPNPVARMIAGTLLESTTGGSGRRRTAALTKAMRERIYMGDLARYEDTYVAWRNRRGGSMFKDALGNEHRAQFDRAVALERENRRLGLDRTADANVTKAADVLDEAYTRMRKDQQAAGTIGAARLGDDSVGYVHRVLSPQWIMGASNAQRTALSNKLAEQLSDEWGDPRFARDIAARYIDRVRTEAYGGVAVPANLASPEAAGILRDVLRAMAVPEDQIELQLGRFSRGGASHTKKRLDLDLTETIDLPDGGSFRMYDAFESDQAKLFQSYARRVSGEVALSQYGVLGDQGLKLLRRAMQFGPDGQRATPAELEAFDQVAAEFLGRPMAGTGNRYLDSLRLLAGASRLGGMAFTQFAEMANSIGLLGVTGALKYVRDMPSLISDVAKGKPSELLSSIELVGGPLGQDHRVIFPYQEPNDIRIYGRDSISAFERIVRGGANAVPWLSGWHYVHAAQVRGISEQIVHKAMRFIRDGQEDVALAGMGITPELAARIKADLPLIARFDENGALVALDITKAADPAAMADFVQVVHRGGRQIIQGTYIGETGKWAHNDLLRILTQFRTFSITSMEKQWTRQRADFGTAKAFGLLMGSMAFALPIHLARVSIAAQGREDKETYLETQLSPQMLARATLNYVSLSGLAGDVLDAGAAVAGYEMTGVRGGGKGVLDNVPTIGYVNSAVQAVKERDPKDLIRSLPGGNLPFLVPVVNAAAD